CRLAFSSAPHTSPQSPDTCLCRKKAGAWPERVRASRAPGVATTWPRLNFDIMEVAPDRGTANGCDSDRSSGFPRPGREPRLPRECRPALVASPNSIRQQVAGEGGRHDEEADKFDVVLLGEAKGGVPEIGQVHPHGVVPGLPGVTGQNHLLQVANS